MPQNILTIADKSIAKQSKTKNSFIRKASFPSERNSCFYSLSKAASCLQLIYKLRSGYEPRPFIL